MFDFVRKHTKIMMTLMFLLIIPSFVLFGIDGYNRMGETAVAVARVAGVDITQAQWDQAHKVEADRLRELRPNLDARMFDTLEARYTTLERLVRDQVLAQVALKSRLFTTDGRLARYLQEDPGIASLRRPDGKLDMERYSQLVARQGLTPEGFEQNVRQELSKQQIEAAVRGSTLATPAVADLALNAFYERREIQFLTLQSADYAGKVILTDGDLEVFYKSNTGLFQAPEQVDMEYVVLDLETVKRGIQISDVDLKSYYDQNVGRLSGNEERRASHILINAPKNAPATEREKAKARAQELLIKLRAAPESFAELAKVNSQDTGSAVKGGDLDFFQRGAMVKPFEDAVFAMKKGDISEAVESDFGYHIIRLTDIKSPKQRGFEELRSGIDSDLRTQQAQRKYAEVAELFTNTVYEQSDSLKPVADKLKLDIKTVNQLVRQPAPGAAGVLASDKFLAAVFSRDTIDKKRNTEAVETAPSQLAAARVMKHTAARTLPLAEVSAQVRARLIASRAAEMAKRDGAEKLVQWKNGSAKVVLPAALLVSRDQPQGINPTVVTAVLRADASALPAWIGVDLPGGGYTVVRINKVQARQEALQANARQGREQYAQWWSSAEAQAYFLSLKERLDVQMLVAAPTSEQPAKSELARVQQDASK